MIKPSVKSIRISLSFVKALAKYLLTVTGDDLFQLANYTILLPNARACRTLAQELVAQSPHQALLLPKMMPLGDLDPEDLALPPMHEDFLPPAINSYERHGILLHLILKHAKLTGSDQDNPYRITLASQLATDLARLIDQIAWEDLDYYALDKLVPAEYASHWQVTLDFLKIVTHFWPEILKEKGVVDPATHRRLLLESYARKWRQSPPTHPVIAAGSTGSIPATRQLLKVIANLPGGEVILPGLDMEMPAKAWSCLTITHPQYGMKCLLDDFGITRADVSTLTDDVPLGAQAREKAISCSLSPFPFEVRLDQKDLVKAQDQFCYLEAKSPQEEALLIAIYMRKSLATSNKSIALVTPDRDLAEGVKRALKRWNLTPDDSAGKSLTQTPLGSAFILLAQLAHNPVDQVSLLALLKNKYVDRHKLATMVELQALRGQPELKDLEQILQYIDDPETQSSLKDIFGLISWPASGTLNTYVTHHRKALAELLKNDNLEGFDVLQDFMSELEKASPLYPDLSRQEYALLVQDLVTHLTLRQPAGYHPRLFILGPLEARTQKADIMILGGLNEGTWPATMSTDPWLNRPMREEFGLPLPERRIGLSAHDFAQAFCSDEVLLTRALKVNGAPTVPSRWFMRLKAIFDAHEIQVFDNQPTVYHAWADQLTQAQTYRPCQAPEPRPPLTARPRHLSVSSVNMWMRDPYALYAKKILGLKKLDPLNYEVSAREKGIMIHRALELFSQHNIQASAPDALERLIEIGYDVFQNFFHTPIVRGFWWPRFLRIAKWFIDQQKQQSRSTVIFSEIWGRLVLQGHSQPFTISAKADRIDSAPEGVHIIDYKTGTPASTQEVHLGYACQLPLEAAIAAAGGFEDLGARPVTALSFWKLTGGDPPGEIISIKGDVAALATQALQGLNKLIETFDQPDTPYYASPRNKYTLQFNDYKHLARIDEWNRSPEENTS